MSARPYRYAATLSWGGDTPTAEIEVECAYSVAWGSPASGHHGPPEDYDPGAGDVVEDIRILTVDGKPWPVDLSYRFQTPAQDHQMLVDELEMHHEEAMIEAAAAFDVQDDEEIEAQQALFHLGVLTANASLAVSMLGTMAAAKVYKIGQTYQTIDAVEREDYQRDGDGLGTINISVVE